MHKLSDTALGPHLMPPSAGHPGTEPQEAKPLLGCVVSWLGREGLQEAPNTPHPSCRGHGILSVRSSGSLDLETADTRAQIIPLWGPFCAWRAVCITLASTDEMIGTTRAVSDTARCHGRWRGSPSGQDGFLLCQPSVLGVRAGLSLEGHWGSCKGSGSMQRPSLCKGQWAAASCLELTGHGGHPCHQGAATEDSPSSGTKRVPYRDVFVLGVSFIRPWDAPPSPWRTRLRCWDSGPPRAGSAALRLGGIPNASVSLV